MKILYLPLRAEWYDLIESGEKVEEYRKLKPYWIKRICRYKGITYKGEAENHCINKECPFYISSCKRKVPTDITHVRFSYGYTKRTMTFEVVGISIGIGKNEWGAPKKKDVFIIKLGQRLF